MLQVNEIFKSKEQLAVDNGETVSREGNGSKLRQSDKRRGLTELGQLVAMQGPRDLSHPRQIEE
jgi:hypothetical protein